MSNFNISNNMNITANNITDTINKIVTNKSKMWDYLHTFNVMSKKAKSSGKDGGINLHACYNSILQYAELMVKYKLYRQALNSGYSTYNEAPNMEHWKNIFMLCEKKEILKGLNKIHFIKKEIKAAKGKKITQVETFNEQKLTQLKRDITIDIANIQMKIDNFNNNTSIEIDDDPSMCTEEKIILTA